MKKSQQKKRKIKYGLFGFVMAIILVMTVALLEGGMLGIPAGLALFAVTGSGMMYAAMKMEIMLFEEGSLLERVNRMVIGQKTVAGTVRTANAVSRRRQQGYALVSPSSCKQQAGKEKEFGELMTGEQYPMKTAV